MVKLHEPFNQSVESPLAVRRKITLLRRFISLTIRDHQEPIMSSATHPGSVGAAGAPVAMHTTNKQREALYILHEFIASLWGGEKGLKKKMNLL